MPEALGSVALKAAGEYAAARGGGGGETQPAHSLHTGEADWRGGRASAAGYAHDSTDVDEAAGYHHQSRTGEHVASSAAMLQMSASDLAMPHDMNMGGEQSSSFMQEHSLLDSSTGCALRETSEECRDERAQDRAGAGTGWAWSAHTCKLL